MYEWFEDNKSEDDEVEPPERLIYDYGIDILTEGDELLPQALVQISLRGVK